MSSQAVILVGGQGTRLRPLTLEIPKPMLPVLNHPFLEHTIAYLKKYGFNDIILASSYLSGFIRDYLDSGDKREAPLKYVVEATPLGTAGAVKNAEPHLKSSFVVLNGDIFADLNLADMLAFHRNRQAKVTIALTWVDNPSAFGVVETETGSRVKRFIEKPAPDQITTHWINAGIYILEPEVLQHVPKDTNYMFERGLFPLLLERGEPVYGYPHHGYWLDMGTLEKYLGLNCDLLQAKTTSHLSPPPNRDGTYGKTDAAVHPAAQITGPVAIGRRCRIGEGARIVGPVVIGDDCHIGAGAYLESSVLWNGASVSAGASHQRCVICRKDGKEQIVSCDGQ